MKKAFLDLDGTLLDSKKRHTLTLKKVLHEYCLDKVDVVDYMDYKIAGYSTKKYLKEVHQFSDELALKISDRWCELIETTDMLKEDVWYEDSYLFLEFLVKNEYKPILVTARKHEFATRKFLEKYEGYAFFEKIIIVSPQDAIAQKKKVIQSQVEKQDILVGDTEVDYEAGNYCSISTYMLNRGFRSSDFWKNRNIQSFTNLLELKEYLLNN